MSEYLHRVAVIGHRNPDTDSICSAIAYAELKNLTTANLHEARRAGELNQETAYVLKRFGLFGPKDYKIITKLTLNVTLPAAILTSFAAFEADPSLFLCILTY